MDDEVLTIGDMKIYLKDPINDDEEIYKGELLNLGNKKVAVKKIRKDDFKDYKIRIERELKTVREIQDEKISKLMDVNDLKEHEDFYYIAYDEFDTTLRTVINEGIENYDVKQILMNAIEGLEYLHSKGIIHRDIRPENVLIKDSTSLSSKSAIGKVSNFALSKELLPGCNLQSISQSLIPTGYVAPELYEHYMSDADRTDNIPSKRQKVINESVDIFSMGIVMFEALTNGVHPFSKGVEGNEQENINKKVKPNFKPFGSRAVKMYEWEIEPAKQLISSMFDKHLKRPKASDVLNHPFFWSKVKIEKFFYASSGYMTGNQQYENELENLALDKVWGDRLKKTQVMMDFIMKPRGFDQNQLIGTANLLRFVRNLISHSYDRNTSEIRDFLSDNKYENVVSYVLHTFPELLFHVYKVMEKHQRVVTIKEFYCDRYSFN